MERLNFEMMMSEVMPMMADGNPAGKTNSSSETDEQPLANPPHGSGFDNGQAVDHTASVASGNNKLKSGAGPGHDFSGHRN